MAQLLTFVTPQATKPADRTSQMLAAAALLLFVVAGLSVLRLGSLMSRGARG